MLNQIESRIWQASSQNLKGWRGSRANGNSHDMRGASPSIFQTVRNIFGHIIEISLIGLMDVRNKWAHCEIQNTNATLSNAHC